jgi:protein-disulfide isomerase
MRKLLIVVGALLVCGAVAFVVFKQATPAKTETPAASTQPTPAATTTTPPAAGQQTADASEPALYPDDMYLGKADAKITIIEYASLSCPHCAKFNAEVLPRVTSDYIDKGLVRWVYRDYPLNNPAYLAAVLAHCGSPLRYFGLLDKLFRSQDYWAAQPQPIVALKQIGVNEGIDEKTYDACLADQKLKDKIISRLQEASTKYKVEATPSFLIGGKLYSGELPFDDIKKLIDNALGHS